LLDEPTNHLDLDSKDVLLDALIDYGGTLIFVSHDRYFVDRLANKVIEIGGGEALVYPGNYEEFLWSKKQHARASDARGSMPGARGQVPEARGQMPGDKKARASNPPAHHSEPRGAKETKTHTGKEQRSAEREAQKRAEAESRRLQRENEKLRKKIADLEARIADRERLMKELEASMSQPGFYEDREAAKPVLDRHQALMWEVGDLMHQWEEVSHSAERLTKS
jgi:ATP-binding cassette subfamily F protein 3